MKKENTYMQVITSSEGEAGEILLYGYIGQDFWWWPEKEEESITDITFKKAFNELAAKHDRINIRINSPGGSLLHGNAIISTIMNSKVEVHTYNDGMAASMAASIWLASPNRHMGVNATLMLHNTMNGIWGNAKEMREMAHTLDKFTSTTAALISTVTEMKVEEVKEKFFNDYQDHWLTRQECVEMGFITEAEDSYDHEEVVSKSQAQTMSYSDLVSQFGDMEKNIINAPWWRRAAAIFKGPNESNKDMNVQELKDSIETGELSADDVKNILAELEGDNSSDTTATTQAEENIARLSALEIAIENLTNQFTSWKDGIEDSIQKLGDQPAGKPAKPEADGDIDDNDGGDSLQQQYKKDLEQQATFADNWTNPFSGI